MMRIGNTGMFQGKDPLVIPDKIMTVVSLSNIQALVAGNIDINTLTYKGVFAPDVFGEHVKENIIIATFKDDNGSLFYYPESYIQNATRVDIIKYVDKALLVSIGAHRDNKTFHSTTQRILDVIEEVEGVKAHARLIDVSKPRSVDRVQDLQITQARMEHSANIHNPYRLLADRERHIAVLEARIQNYITFILQYIESCTSSDICCGEVVTGVGGSSAGGAIVTPQVNASDAYGDKCGNADTMKDDIPSAEEYYINTSR